MFISSHLTAVLPQHLIKPLAFTNGVVRTGERHPTTIYILVNEQHPHIHSPRAFSLKNINYWGERNIFRACFKTVSDKNSFIFFEIFLT